MELGDRIAAWLRVKELTQKDLATKTKISRAAVNGYVHGTISPSQDALNAIVSGLDLTLVEFHGPIPKGKKAAPKARKKKAVA